jgi:hypothetical protein
MTKNRRTLLHHLEAASQPTLGTPTFDEELRVEIDSVCEHDVDASIPVL